MKKKLLLGLALAMVAMLAIACTGGTAGGTSGGEAKLTRSTGAAGETRWTYGCLGSASGAVQDLNCREVTIAIENAYLPFNYVDLTTGDAGGWDYDAWKEICTRLHCQATFVETGWDGMIQAVANGQFDAAADGITITDERKQEVDFSIGYINIEQRLLVRVDESRFESMDDFVSDESLKIGTQTGTTNFDTAKKYLPEDRIEAYETFPIAVQALLAGDVDAVIIDETAGQGYIGENSEQLKLVGPSLSSDQLGFIFPKGSDLVAPVNEVLEAMKADGTLEKLSVQYFGEAFSITYDDIGPGAYATEAP
jgi:polar amino acid transport system substrate-binding protein